MLIETPTYLQETVLDCDDYFHALLNDIGQASISIDFETYIFNDDNFGKKIAEALAEASARRVKVRLLIDGLKLSAWHGSLARMEKSGVAIRIFHPIPWRFWQWKYANLNSSVLFKLLYFIYKINSRNHRKTCIIDNEIVYIGSVNITKEHLNKELGGDGWADTVIRIVSSPIKPLQSAFNYAWQRYPTKKELIKSAKQLEENSIFRLNYSRRRRRLLYRSLLRKIQTSQNRVWLVSPYFNPDYYLLRALLKAAKRGVDVKIMLPYKSDVTIMRYVGSTFYVDMLKAGIAIFEYLPAILHSKSIIIDDWYCIGSSNFNHRSLFHDLEVDVIVQTPTAKKNIEMKFLEDLNKSKKISVSDLKKYSFFRKLFARLLLFGKHFF